MQYPLIFPNGEPGWHRKIARLNEMEKKKRPKPTCRGQTIYDIQSFTDAEHVMQTENKDLSMRNTQRSTVSCREYYCYKLQIREHDKSFLLHIGRLLQQYVVDMYIKIETSRLEFFRTTDIQNRLRNEVYRGLLDSITQGCQTGLDVGKRIILPTSFVGGPRDMRKRYMDAITLVQRYGKPDIFLTITSNPNWPEIKALCLPFEEIQNRPDLTSRIFRAKLQVLKKELFNKEIFGHVLDYAYVIEFQKRGLPHAHFLLILDKASKLFHPEAFDRIVCAELPDPHAQPYLFSLVVRHMMHGPCGSLNPTCPCMKNSSCKFNYPKEFSENTKYGTNSYPIYRRRNNNNAITIRGAQLDNSWVVPFNPYLLAKFNCHINVEICSTIQAIKYIYKYIYKGHDKILYTLVVNENNPVVDEIKNFQCARWISPPEAIWRIFKFDLNHVHPSVICLPIHLENEQVVTFPANQSLTSITKNLTLKKTMLTQFFFMNEYNEYARKMKCLYIEFPEYFTWHSDSKEWEPRKKQEVIGRIYSCRPSDGEKFYLKLLLMHVPKPTSFKYLRTVNGETFSTFREAAQMLGLMEGDNTADMCIQEAATYLLPHALRQLFATVLVHCNPTNPKQLWLKYENFLSEDFVQNKKLNTNAIRHKVLNILANYLYSMGKKLENFFPASDDILISFHDSLTKELQSEQDIVTPTEDLAAVEQLNTEQKYAYNRILYHVNNNLPNVFFVDGPGGTGKTFLYKALLATIRSAGHIALATATSGVAASLLRVIILYSPHIRTLAVRVFDSIHWKC
ncbi:uncharacterized protein [Primulina eburnea]|uniref:uncharacterized protein n=1 Tax=Primulina eburnea TaxID=1245227 RepID=UPI003C6C1AD2